MTEPATDEREMTFFDSSAMPDAESEPEAAETTSYFEEAATDDAVPITGAAPQAVGDPTRYSRTVGEGNAERFFPARTSEEAEASLEAIARFCTNCPISHRCPEEACAVYRAEATALAVLEGAEGRTTVGGVVIPASQPGAPA